MVVSSEGYFYSYSIDLENGGECSLMKQYSCVVLPFKRSSDVIMFPDCLTRQTRPRMTNNVAGDAARALECLGPSGPSVLV